MIIKGYQEQSNISVLNRYIPIAATCGGMCIGLITILANLMGCIGSGTGILLSVSIIYGYFEKIANDKKESDIGRVI